MSEATIAAVESEQIDEQSTDSIERFLTFVSDNIIFGVSTNNMVEIITNQAICALPMVPDYIKGVINVRGQTIPVIDIRIRMGKMPTEYTDTTCILILTINDTEVGIIVDAVEQVLDIDQNKMSPIPIENRQELTSSMISLEDGRTVLFLDCEALIRSY